MPALTVGLPVFNAMAYLPATVDSLLRQTFRDFELLIVNDGSTDGSLAYLESLTDPRIRLVSQANQGLSATLNWMLRQSGSSWHVRQDADDIAYPHRLQRIWDAIRRQPDAGMFHTLADQIPAAPGRRPFRTTIAGPEHLRAITKSGYLLAICHPTVALHAERALAVGGYKNELKAAQDVDLWWRIALRFDIRIIEETTLAYRLTPAGLSNTGLHQQEVEAVYAQYLLLSENWGWQPQPLEAVRPVLETMIDLPQIRAREHLRRAAIDYSAGQFSEALRSTWRAVSAAPRYFTRRVLGQAHSHDFTPLQVNGLDPLMFAQRCSELWRL
jgi:hypothetical protein